MRIEYPKLGIHSVVGLALVWSGFFASPSKAEAEWMGETFGDWRFPKCGSHGPE